MQLTTFDAPSVQSVEWYGDDLVDWVAGGCVYSSSGAVTPANVRYSYSFDAAAVSTSGEYVALYTRRATKGLLLRHGKVIREFNRSFYQADAYDFPIEFVTLADGREAIAHCPAEYNRLDFEVAATGEIVTTDSARKPADYFFSRLKTSPNGQYLASGGWVWHPQDVPHVYEVQSAEKNPQLLDGHGADLSIWADESSLAFLSDTELVVGIGGYANDDETEIVGTEIRTFALKGEVAELKGSVRTTERITLISRFAGGGVLALGKYPLIVDSVTGEILKAWPDLTLKSVPRSATDLPSRDFIIAVNDDCTRFALWRDGKIHVLS